MSQFFNLSNWSHDNAHVLGSVRRKEMKKYSAQCMAKCLLNISCFIIVVFLIMITVKPLIKWASGILILEQGGI